MNVLVYTPSGKKEGFDSVTFTDIDTVLKNADFRYAKQRIMSEIKEKYDEEKIEFAYPYVKIFRGNE